MHGRTPTADQYTLDYDGPFAERMAVLRAKLRGIDPAELGLTPGVWELVCEVVQAVFAHAGAERGAWSRADAETLAAGTLADGEPLSRSQLYRYRTVAGSVGLLVRAGRHPGYRWRVDLDRLDALAEQGRAATANNCEQLRTTENDRERLRTTANHRGNPEPFNPLPKTQTPSPPDPEPAGHGAAAAGPFMAEKSNPPSPPRTARPSQPVGASGPDDHVEGGEGDFCKEATPDARTAALAALRSTGLGYAQETLATLQRAGGGPSDALALVAVFCGKPGAWGPGAIFVRAKRWSPDQRPEEHWPPPDPKWLANEEARRSAERRAAELAAGDARRAEREQQRERLREERAGYSVLAEYGRLTTV